ncbi:MAG: DNA cytosine methyltransferase [Devosia sp.]|nr:DNA cytosine methyltransferase [Devosia sp.]
MTVVLFAGMGGGCDGLEAAGYSVHLAINHDPLAIAVHEARHPHTQHMRCDVFEVDPRAATKGRGVRVLHASPDCTHFSVAKGSRPVSKRRRSLAWVVVRWAGQVRPEVITLENVQEIQTWGPLIAKRDKATGRVLKLDGTVAAKGEVVPVQNQQLVPDARHKGRIWRAWLKHLARLGYHFEGRVLICADYGIPTIRKRFFGVAKADGSAVEWPERTHAPRKLAKKLKLKRWVGAHTIIDWSLPMKSIFDRKKPLAEATLRRIARGIMRYVIEAKDPFIVPITHHGERAPRDLREPLSTLTTANRGELMVVAPHMSTMRNAAKPFGAADEPLHTITAGGAGIAMVAAAMTKFRQGDSGADLAEPLPTFTANNFEKRPGGAPPLGIIAATMVQTGYGEREGQAPRALDLAEPMGTQVAGGGKAALVAAFLAQHNTGNSGHDARDPLSTITTGGERGQTQQGVVTATLGRLRGADIAGQDIREPLPTQTCGGGHEMLILPFLQTYYGSGDNNHDVRDPLHTLTVGDRHGLVTVAVDGQTMVMTDILMRMLDWSEGARAHGFDPDSLRHEIEVIDAKGRVKRRQPTKTECGHLIGNSVPPKMVELLARCNVTPELMVAAE